MSPSIVSGAHEEKLVIDLFSHGEAMNEIEGEMLGSIGLSKRSMLLLTSNSCMSVCPAVSLRAHLVTMKRRSHLTNRSFCHLTPKPPVRRGPGDGAAGLVAGQNIHVWATVPGVTPPKIYYYKTGPDLIGNGNLN